MTDEQIRARCKEFLSVNVDKVTGRVVLHQEIHTRLESLYCEAIAAGAQEVWIKVIDKALQAECDDASPIWMLEWCRAEAQRVKENHA